MDNKCNGGRCCENVSERDFIDALSARICETYSDGTGVNHNEGWNLPRESEVLDILWNILELVFPGFNERIAHSQATLRFSVGETIATTYVALRDIILRTLRYNCAINKNQCDCHRLSEQAARELLEAIPELREIMKLDVKAAYEGDPAARSLDEIVLSYPGLRAITIQRIAHELYKAKVPMIPRMMGEYAHRITGIDIHPGAELGRGIFIDHGTGVVIGETAELGNNVKIYQGVTLGALSFPKDACGLIIKGAKRHPTIEDDVTIYAGATILGAIVIGKGSVIGGNVWITESIKPETRVLFNPPEQNIRQINKGSK